MSDEDFALSSWTLDERNAQLEKAAHELDVLFSPQSGETKPSPEGDFLRSLVKEDKVEFVGYPSVDQIKGKNLPARVPPEPVTVTQLMKKYNFFYVKLPILLRAQDNWAFNELRLHMLARSPGAPEYAQPHIYLIYPDEKIETPLKASFTNTTKVDANVNAGVNLSPQSVDIGVAQGSLGAGVNVKQQTGFGVEINKSFESLVARIAHSGVGSGEAFLKIEDARTLFESMNVALVIQLLKETTTLELDVQMEAYHYFRYAPKRIIDHFNQLFSKTKDLFDEHIPTRAVAPPPPAWNLTPLL
jgi:hypothetical protein